MSPALIALVGHTVAYQVQTGTPLTIQPAVAQLVIVDAYVMDRKGRPVTGLRQEDFELFEDNRPVPIAAFEPPRAGANGAVSATEATTGSGVPGVDQPGEPLTVVIYVDRWLLSPPGRKRALDQAALLAESLIARGARVVVVAEEKGLRPLSPLTRDPQVVREALMQIQRWATSSPGAIESRQVLENIEARIEVAKADRSCEVSPACLCVLPELVTMIRGYSTFRNIEVHDAASRLAFLVNTLRGLEGRKTVIYVSEGLEQRPGIQLYDQLGAICPAVFHKDASQIYAPMQEFETSSMLLEAAARANAARVTFYPIDARGLSSLSSADISQPNREYIPSAKNDSIKNANLVNQYRLLADETGGFAIIRGLDPGSAIKRFDADTLGHYIVGFVPGDPDGKTHRLRLNLTAKAQAKRNAEIRHRQSYFRAEAPARRGQRALSALLFGLEENALQARADVRRTNATTVRVAVSVSLSALRPLPGTDGGEARVQIVISFRRTQGENIPVTVREKEVSFSLTADEMSRDGGVREILVDVPVDLGGYEFAIGIEDIASGSAAYLRRSLEAS